MLRKRADFVLYTKKKVHMALHVSQMSMGRGVL